VEISEPKDDSEKDTKLHYKKIVKRVTKGTSAGKDVLHFQCKYCDRSFQGPSSSSFLKHARKVHPSRCPDLIPGQTGDLGDKKRYTFVVFFYKYIIENSCK
jgi:hypothetical protein